MHASAVRQARIAPSASSASAVAALFLLECDREVPLVSLPTAETSVVFRFGPAVRGGIDAYAFGGRQRAHRKVIGAGHRAVTARFHLGASAAVSGASAAAIAGRIVPLDEVWGSAAARRLLDRLAAARDTRHAVAIVETAIAERVSLAHARGARPQLALEAADRLASANVSEVADHLGVSERHLRRVFREAVGVSPKAFARLRRFQRAVRAAREDGAASWASIAAGAGYYDQAHLITEFRAIAGVTPRVLLGELRAAPEVG
jgi:AraC-like DNA-binding protein